MVTRLSKALSALLVIGFAVSWFVPSTVSYLSLVPGRTLPMVWNIVTSSFLITHPLVLVVDIGLLLVLARVVEPTYGSKEFLKLIFMIAISVGTVVFFAVYVTFASTMNGKLLYSEFNGFHGVLAGLLVGVKQIMPDHEIKLVGVVKLRVKYLPSILILLATAVAVALNSYLELPFVVIGTYSAWLYLRFFQQQPDSIVKGDPSDEFKFSSFFPSFLEGIIDPVASIFGTIFRLRQTSTAGAGGMQMNQAPSMLGSDAVDANRRRERGAKALEERLGQKSSGADVEAGEGSPAPAAGATA